MSKYTIHSTKEDFKKLYDELEEMEKNSNTILDWKKIKRASYDSLVTFKSSWKRKFFV